MNNEAYFEIDDGVLVGYTGSGGDLVIPEGVKTISDYYKTFPEGVEFTSVALPNSLERDKSWWGWGWPVYIKTESYIVSSEHPWLACIDGVVYDKSMTEMLAFPVMKKGEITLPKTFRVMSAPESLEKASGLTAFRVDPENPDYCTQDGLLYTKDRKELVNCPAGKTGTLILAAETEEIKTSSRVGSVLDNCLRITEYVVPSENRKFSSIDGVLYNKSGSRLLKYPAGREGEFVVPDHVCSIGNTAFKDAVGLTKLTIPQSVSEISPYLLGTADNLKELIMPGVSFRYDPKLSDALEWIELTGEGSYYYSRDGLVFCKWDGNEVLSYCPRGRTIPVTIPDGVVEISAAAFQCCQKLPEIRFAGKVPKMAPDGIQGCEVLRISSDYLRVADKVPAAFAEKAESFAKEDFQWLAIHQTTKAWKEAVEQNIKSLDKADFFAGMLDLAVDLKKIPKATGMNLVEFVQRWTAEIPSEQICRLREILAGKKCTAAVEAMDADPQLKKSLSGESESPKRLCKNPIEQLVRDNWSASKLVRNLQQRIRTGIAYRESEEICDPDVLVYILASYAEQLDDSVRFYSLYKTAYVKSSIHSLADQVAAALDRETFLNFLESYATNSLEPSCYMPAHDGSLLALGRYGSSAQISKLISSMRKWEKLGPVGRKAIIIARGGLMLSDTREAMLALDKTDVLGYYAKLRGTTAEVIRDTVLADFNLDEDGRKSFDLGNGHSVEIRLNTDLSWSLFDPAANKVVKSIPKKGADPQLYTQVSAEFSDMKKNAKKIAKARNDQLFKAFLDATEFDAATWKKIYLKNPLLRQVASLLVWEQNGLYFTIWNREILSHDGSTVTLTDAPIRLAHPMEMEASLVDGWQKYFTGKGLKQMFQQIWEPVFAPESVQKDRYHGFSIPMLTLSSQNKHGIGVDGVHAYSEVFELWTTDCVVQTEASDWRYVPGVNDDLTFKLKDFTFRKYTRWTNHIVAWFDRYLIVDKIKKDDTSIQNMLPGFSLAQITEFINVATENNCPNVTALLLDYKNQHFADFDPMEEFSLDL